MFKKIVNFIKKLFGINGGQVNFIGGGEALPSPFDKDRELELVQELSNGSEVARNLLIEHNLRLVVYIAKKFENTNVDLDDLISIGTMGLIKAVNSFNVEKQIKLATFASRCIENEILMHLRKISRTKKEVSLDEPINVDWEGNVLMLADIIGSDTDLLYNNLENEIEKEMLFKSFEKLDDKEKDIIRFRFGIFGSEKKTQKEIADYFGISQSYISRLEKRIMSKMKDEMEKLV